MPPKRSTGQNVPPMDVAYMKNLKFYLTLIDAWPYKEFGSNERVSCFILRNNKSLFVTWVLTLLSGIGYLKKNFGVIDFVELGHSCVTVFMNATQVQRLTMAMTKSYKTTVVEFVQKIHLVHHKDKSEYSLKVYNQVEKISKYFAMVVQNQMAVGAVLFNLVPVFNNYRNGLYGSNKPVNLTLEHTVHFDLPFDYTSSVNWGYMIVFVANFFFALDCTSTFVNFDLLLFIIVFHLWGHLKILSNKLSTFPKPEMQGYNSGTTESLPLFSDAENEKITKLFIENIQHHRMIKKFMAKTSTTFGLTLCVFFIFYLVSGCILLVKSIKLDANSMTQYIPLVCIFNQQLIQISVVVELFGTASETLKDVAYSVSWESMNKKNQKILLFFLVNLQRPLSLKALGMVPVGVQTMASVMKTSFSYFMLLRTFTAEEQ